MNFQEQLKYDKLQKIQERLRSKGIQSGAKTIIETTQADVTNVMDVKPEGKEIVPEIVELDSENYGAPPDDSGIAAYKNGTQLPYASDTEPQAYEDDKGNWCYNHPGAIQLAKILGRTLPDANQLVMAIDANPDNFRQNVSLYCGTEVGGFESGFYYENRSTFLSSSENPPRLSLCCVFV